MTTTRIYILSDNTSMWKGFGSMHLLNASESSLHQTVQVLTEFSVEQIYPCHCTVKKSIDFLKEQLPGKVFDIGTGSVTEI